MVLVFPCSFLGWNLWKKTTYSMHALRVYKHNTYVYRIFRKAGKTAYLRLTTVLLYYYCRLFGVLWASGEGPALVRVVSPSGRILGARRGLAMVACCWLYVASKEAVWACASSLNVLRMYLVLKASRPGGGLRHRFMRRKKNTTNIVIIIMERMETNVRTVDHTHIHI